MKLIALKDFRNVPDLNLDIDDAVHDDHIHKGATFEIGTGKTVKDCAKADQVMIAQLTVAGCIGDANDEKLVAAVKAEVAADKKRDAAAAKATQAANDSVLVAQLIKLLQGAQTKPAA